MAQIDTDAVVLRAIRFGEADSILSVLTPGHGRVSAIAKGARRAKSKLGGRLQPGVRSQLVLYRGRGDMATVRTATVVDAHAGLWLEGYRLRAAGSVLEGALRTLPEDQPDEGAFNLICRALDLLARAPVRDTPPRLDPVVLGAHAKLLVVAGLVPRLGPCDGCVPGEPMVAFSAREGGALCRACAARGEAVSEAGLAALAALLSRPLAEAPDMSVQEALAVERMVGLSFREHMGVELRSATPIR